MKIKEGDKVKFVNDKGLLYSCYKSRINTTAIVLSVDDVLINVRFDSDGRMEAFYVSNKRFEKINKDENKVCKKSK